MRLWIRKLLDTYVKLNLRAFNTPYDLNGQYYGTVMFFVIFKMVFPDTRTGWSDIKTKFETTNMSYFKKDVTKSNLHIL